MATTPEYNEFVCERLEPFGAVRSRKMFGEYMVYLKHRLTRAHREKQLKMSCQALHNAPPNRT